MRTRRVKCAYILCLTSIPLQSLYMVALGDRLDFGCRSFSVSETAQSPLQSYRKTSALKSHGEINRRKP